MYILENIEFAKKGFIFLFVIIIIIIIIIIITIIIIRKICHYHFLDWVYNGNSLIQEF